ncbi:putative ATP-dependent RNA helicase TDRD9 [Austrofundulus limnaeus]|uniref:ATP-dependent RNA helicase TDRD9 n=1 Tax=Austrofundulus limnaeus TaxID=52670 RepID=A0A2I4CXU4_AUSLI|nr:PREDICTED: putative ATP-dependent RNA helicase TDRD9 [Austrofundulus limnaeus]
MSNPNSPMQLSVYPTEQIESCSGNRLITHMKFSRVNADIQSQSVSPVGVLSSIDPASLPSNRLFVVNITEVLDVGHFWGFPADEASLEKQRLLTGEINKRTLSPVTVSLYPNLLCLAPYSESSEQCLYYRAKILHMRGNTVEVFFLDFGNTAVVSCSSLRELPSDLLSHPFQAQEFQVVEMCPSSQSIILGNRWSSRARNCFMILVKDQSVIVSLFSILYGVMRVEVFINVESKKTSVVDILVKEGYAVKTDENFDSQQIHETLMTLYKDMEKGTYVPISASSSWKEHEKEEKELIDSLLAHFSKSTPSGSKVCLKGPLSPYKINFHSLSRKIYCRTASVDKTSINSMALNENPHFKYLRMLVAASVSVNSTGTRILLRDTSLLPDIPGLPGLVMMLFTPVMELRTNEERTSYTGALLGLGFNSQTEEAILPENDIELAFDVKFDVEDITEINALRVAINRLLCNGPSSTLHLGSDKINQQQEDCRDRLTRLFMRSPPREAVPPLYYEKPGKWNQVDPSLKMSIAEPGGGNTRGVLFQLHPVILLN